MVPAPLPPGSVIGVLGGGQLGRMISIEAARLGLVTHVFDPAVDPPAGHVAHRVTTASYDDEAALRAFAESVDVITYEFENVPVESARWLAEHDAARLVEPGEVASTVVLSTLISFVTLPIVLSFLL